MKARPRRISSIGVLGGAAALILVCAGCGGYSSYSEIAEFARSSWRPEIDYQRLVEARVPSRPCNVGPGDVLNVQLVNVITPLNAPREMETPATLITCRVSEDGTIALPLIGLVEVAGRSLTEIEDQLTAAYHPRFVVSKPTIHVSAVQYATSPVSVVGAVEHPGIYDLRRDEMTLVSALMKAGGITKDGASRIRIRHMPGYQVRAGNPESIVTLPLKGMSSPFKDVDLLPGDTIEVQRQPQEYFTVAGLVRRPGAYPYKAGEHYNAYLAVAFAGGPADIAPDRVCVYRQTYDGETRKVKVPLDPSVSRNLAIQPGDVVTIEHTLGSRIRSFFAGLLKTGVFVGANYDLAK